MRLKHLEKPAPKLLPMTLTRPTMVMMTLSITIANKPKKKAGRKPLPASLPRIRIEHRIPQAEQVCRCGCQRVEIGEVTSQQLDIIPAKVQVIVNVRKKYACQHCESGVITAPLPAQPIPKSNASPNSWPMSPSPSIRMVCHYTVRKQRSIAVVLRSHATPWLTG